MTPLSRAYRLLLSTALLAAPLPRLCAQISLPSAVNLGLRNSPKVRSAQAELTRARAALSESKDAFVPAVSANGGVGKSTGAPLGPPVVFSISAQSLVYSFSQADYIRAARAGVESARLALDAAQADISEDVTSTYVALDNALQRRAVEAEALGFAHRLVAITGERFEAGVDSHMELTKARYTEAQIHLQQLLIDDDIAEQAGHLARVIGLGARGLTTEHKSIPRFVPPAPEAEAPAPGPAQLVGVSAAFAAARAKQFTARGDKKFLLRPQIAFSANYSRIATAFTTYTQYYPYFGHDGNSFNSLNLGVEITVPILDMVRRAKAHESAAEAVRAFADAETQQMTFLDGREKLQRSTAELAARHELASLDRDLAQDQLSAILIRLQASAGAAGGDQTSPQLTPRDEQNARLQERLKTLDMLTSDLQLQQAEISLLRQQGSLSGWLAATLPSALASPSGADFSTAPAAPATVGIPPAASTPPGSALPGPSTVGVPPASNPGGPVTAPGSPAAPPTTSTTPHP